MPEAKGTVKQMNPSGKSWLMDEFDCVWSKGGKNYDGPAIFAPGEKVTMVYDEVIKADGTSSFFVTSAWPTTGQARTEPATGGPPAAKTAVTEPTQDLPPLRDPLAGPVPTPPSREVSIEFQVCLKAAIQWVLERYPDGHPQRCEGQVLFATDLFFRQAGHLVYGAPKPEVDSDGAARPTSGDPGPTEEPS